MKSYTYNFEIQTLLEGFVQAFNDIMIKRYDKDKNIIPGLSAVKVLYVFSPKTRVFNTLNNAAPGGLTIPVVAVTIASISRDNTRVFNKLQGFDAPYANASTSLNYDKKIPQPVPINIGVNITAIAKYQSDMDQILSNFIPYTDPYVVISWKMPGVNPAYPLEIRSEVLWNGNVAINYPLDIPGEQHYRVTADTSFTIKGWVFRKMEEVNNKIYVINSDYSVADCTGGILQSLDVLSTEYMGISARPQF